MNAPPRYLTVVLLGLVLLPPRGSADDEASTLLPRYHEPDQPHGPAADSNAEPLAPRLGEPISDRRLRRFLEVEGRKLVHSGQTLTNWDGKLSLRACGVKLPSTPSRPLDSAEVAERLAPAVAVVGTFYLCDKCSKEHTSAATGFFVTTSGALATSRHVLGQYARNGRGVVVLTRDGRICAVRDVLAAAPGSDLLVLQVEGGPFKALPLASRPTLQGSAAFVMSHPDSHFYCFGSGTVSRQFVDGRGRNWLTVSADFARGSSGAPVCNQAGAVIGIVNNTESIYYGDDNGRQENLQMVLRNCTPVQALLELLSATGPAPVKAH